MKPCWKQTAPAMALLPCCSSAISITPVPPGLWFNERPVHLSRLNVIIVTLRERLSALFLECMEKFRHYLLGSKFTICNDQCPLSKLFAHDAGVPSTCSARIRRWKLKLSQFNYVLHYSKGYDNVTSDCLCRMPLLETVEEFEPYELVYAINSIDSSFVTSDQINQQTDRDPDIVQLKQFIKFGCPNKIMNPTLSKFKSLIPQMTLMRGCNL